MKLCTYDGCGLKHFAKGYCRKHHARLLRNGSPEGIYDRSGYADLRGVLDTRPGARGYLAINIINDIRYKAKKRGFTWSLSHEVTFKFITSECLYCGFTPKWPETRVGIDRVDNAVGYLENNCVPCCFTCNSAKGEKTLEEFKAWIIKVHGRLSA